MSGQVDIWTDGGCAGNPGPGGWAYVVQADGQADEHSGYDPSTTNNRMELTAVREALQRLSAQPSLKRRAATVHTDSQYVQKGITQWIYTWEKNGWRTSAKKPVKNSDLWHELWELSKSLSVQWIWVLGHAGNEMNERCDRLVQEAIARGLKHAT